MRLFNRLIYHANELYAALTEQECSACFSRRMNEEDEPEDGCEHCKGTGVEPKESEFKGERDE